MTRPVLAAPAADRRPWTGPRVMLLVDPDDSRACVTELDACHGPARGVAVCHPNPAASTQAALAEDLLIALGKRPGGLTAEGLQGRGWDLARLWATAERIGHLIVLRAHLLAPQRWRELADLAATAGADLWLVSHRPALDPDHRVVLAELTGHRDVAALPHRPWRSALQDLPAAPTTDSPFPPVPDADFPLFRATTRRVLPDLEFARVDAVYRATFHAARTEARAWRAHRQLRGLPGRYLDELLAAAALQRLTVDATTGHEVMTRVRAVQAGFFREAVFLGLAPGTSMPTTVNSTAPRLDPAITARLRGICDPLTACAVTICQATGLHSALRQLRLGEVDISGTDAHVTLAGARYRIPGRVAGGVRAGLAHRLAQLHSGPLDQARDDVADALMFARSDGSPIPEAALGRLLGPTAARAGVALSPPPFRSVQVADLHADLDVNPAADHAGR